MANTFVLPGYAGETSPKAAAKAAAKPRRGFFARVLDAIVETRLRQAEREIAAYCADRGGKFTDEAEREIERRFVTHTRGW